MQLSCSNLYKHSWYQCKISPNGNYLANCVDNRLVIRKNAPDLTILHVFDCLHPIKHVEWSPDSRHVMTANYQASTVQVWSITNTHWKSKIHDTSFGISRARWGPASQSVICSSELSLRLSVWMLKENRVIYMKYPKFMDKGCEVSPDGKYLAVMENRSGKDCLSVYTAPDIRLVKHFQIDTEDAVNIQWSPNSHCIIVWDNCLYYKLLVYRPDGYLCGSYQAYGEGLGIKSLSWSRDSQLLAIGSYDQKVRILRTCTWQPICEFFHAAAIKQFDYPNARINRELQRSSSREAIEYDQIVRRPVNIPILRPEYNTSNPKTGVGMCQFNANGHLLCSQDDSMPTTLWIWDTTKFQCLAVVTQQRAIKHVAWHPSDPNMLIVTCDTSTLYIVNILLDLDADEDSARRIQITPVAGPSDDFIIRKFQFVSDGSSLLVMDKALFGLIAISN